MTLSFPASVEQNPEKSFHIARLNSDGTINVDEKPFATRYSAQQHLHSIYPAGAPEWVKVVTTKSAPRLRTLFADVPNPSSDSICAALAGWQISDGQRVWDCLAANSPIVEVTLADVVTGGTSAGNTALDLVLRHPQFNADSVENADTTDGPQLFTFAPMNGVALGHLIHIGKALADIGYHEAHGLPDYRIRVQQWAYPQHRPTGRHEALAVQHHLHGLAQVLVKAPKSTL